MRNIIHFKCIERIFFINFINKENIVNPIAKKNLSLVNRLFHINLNNIYVFGTTHDYLFLFDNNIYVYFRIINSLKSQSRLSTGPVHIQIN